MGNNTITSKETVRGDSNTLSRQAIITSKETVGGKEQQCPSSSRAVAQSAVADYGKCLGFKFE